MIVQGFHAKVILQLDLWEKHSEEMYFEYWYLI